VGAHLFQEFVELINILKLGLDLGHRQGFWGWVVLITNAGSSKLDECLVRQIGQKRGSKLLNKIIRSMSMHAVVKSCQNTTQILFLLPMGVVTAVVVPPLQLQPLGQHYHCWFLLATILLLEVEHPLLKPGAKSNLPPQQSL